MDSWCNSTPLHVRLENLLLSEYNNNKIEDTDDESIANLLTMDVKILKDRTSENIMLLLNKLCLEKNIYEKTINIYNATLNSSNLKRIKFKNAIMCASVFVAFSLEKTPREEEALMAHFNVTKFRYTKGLKCVKVAVKETRECTNSIETILYKLVRDLNLIENLSEIKTFIADTNFSEIESKCCYRISKKIICSALVYIWILNNKKNALSVEQYCCVCSISCTSIKKVLFKLNNYIETFILKTIDDTVKNFLEKIKTKYSVDSECEFLDKEETINMSKKLAKLHFKL